MGQIEEDLCWFESQKNGLRGKTDRDTAINQRGGATLVLARITVGYHMFKRVRILVALLMSAGLAASGAARPAWAISADLAKKCRALAIKAHPYKIPGVKGPGTAQAERVFFADCVAKGGNVPVPPSDAGPNGNNQSSSPAAAK